MKSLLLLFLISATPILAKEEVNDKKNDLTVNKDEAKKIKEDAAIKGRDYVLIALYIENEYIEKGKKELEKLDNTFEKYQKKLQIATNKKQKESIVVKMKEILVKKKVFEIWKKYHQAYLIERRAYYDKNDKRFFAARAYLKKAKEEYTKLTATTFPNFVGDFYAKYKNNLDTLRKKYIKSIQ